MRIQQLKANKRVHLPATAVTISLLLLFPFIVHLIGGPVAGGRWLPLFYVPVAAVIFFHPGVALTAGLLTPFLNHLLTGSPPLTMAFLLSFELVVFSLVLVAGLRRWPTAWWMAPLAYAVAKFAEFALLLVLPSTLLPMPPAQFFTTSLSNAWPGLLVLLFIHWALVKGARRGG